MGEYSAHIKKLQNKQNKTDLIKAAALIEFLQYTEKQKFTRRLKIALLILFKRI